jgi:hypothetical protein
VAGRQDVLGATYGKMEQVVPGTRVTPTQKSEPFGFPDQVFHRASTSQLKLVKRSVLAASGRMAAAPLKSGAVGKPDELPRFLGEAQREMPGYTGHLPNMSKIAGRTFGSAVRALQDGGFEHGHGQRTAHSFTGEGENRHAMPLHAQVEIAIPHGPNKVHVDGYITAHKATGYTGHVPGRGHRDSMIGATFEAQTTQAGQRLGYGTGRLDQHLPV